MLRHIIVASLLCCTYLACTVKSSSSDDDDDDGGTPSGPTGMDDGKYRPPATGFHTTETEACELLRDAFHSQALSIPGCSKTAPVCPNFLRVQFVTPCMKYDLGTVEACAEYYESIKVCTELVAEDCVVVPYPSTAGTGCIDG